MQSSNWRNLAKLILFPSKNLGKNQLSSSEKVSIKNFFRPSIISFVFHTAPILFCWKIALNLLLFSIQILFLLCLGQIVGDIKFYPSQHALFSTLIVLVVLRFLIAQCNHLVEFKFRENNWKFLSDVFARLKNNKDAPPGTSYLRLIGRDSVIFSQSLTFMTDWVYLPLAFLLGASVILLISGREGLVGILAIVAFLPLSLLISKKRKQLAKRVTATSQVKLDKISHWLKWRSYLYSWQEEKSAFESVRSSIDAELKERQSDSFWRSLDLYSINFGKVVPITFVIMLSLLAYPLQFGVTTILWLTVPLIGIVMTFSRLQVETTQGQAAYDELKKCFDFSEGTLGAKDKIILEDTWSLWEGTLEENTFASNSAPFNALSELGLLHEFGDNLLRIFTRDGSNVSAGQKTRILLARSIHLAIANSCPLFVNATFSSLDPISSTKVLKCLEITKKFVEVDISESSKLQLLNQQALSQDVVTENVHQNSPANGKAVGKSTLDIEQEIPLIKRLYQLLKPYHFLMLLPAAGLSILPVLTTEKADVEQLVLLWSVGIGSFLLAIILGMKIEWSLRKWASEKAETLLHVDFQQSTTDLFQRLSEDFRTVTERISWYLHDGLWITSLFVVASGYSLYLFGPLSLVYLICWGLVCLFVWKLLVPTISLTRRASVVRLRGFLEKLQDVVAISTTSSLPAVNSLQKKMSYEGFNSLFVGSIEADASKIAFASTLAASSGLLLATMIGTGLAIGLEEEAFVFLIAAFLNVDYNLQMFFLALSGFNAQKVSLDRLDGNKKIQNDLQSLVYRDGNHYKTSEHVNLITNKSYSSFNLQVGQTYSLRSPSGTGKTQFLRSLSGLGWQHSSSLEVREYVASLYVDNQFFSIQNWLKEKDFSSFEEKKTVIKDFILSKMAQGKKIFFFDEALTFFSAEEALTLSKELSVIIEKNQGLIILVDHRFTLSNAFSIVE